MFEKDKGPSSITTNVQEGTEEVISISMNSNESEKKHPKLTLKEALKLKELYIIAFIFSFSGLTGNVFSSNYKVIVSMQVTFFSLNELIFITYILSRTMDKLS